MVDLPENTMRPILMACLLVLTGSGCGGGDALVELQIDTPPFVIGNQVVLNGRSFVPAGSSCPQTGELVRFGTLGAHAITYTNAATGITGPVSSGLWVCSADDGRTIQWTSNPITLAPGANTITVRMSTPARTSESTITVQAGS